MALPDLIEMMPLPGPVRAGITVPGSKSITNRALVLAALAAGEVTLNGALWSEDTQVMTAALRALGFDLRVENDPDEPGNRTITVQGRGGKIPHAGTAARPLELFVGNAGTAARFLAALVCLGSGVYRLHGVPRMHERPQAELFQALRELGYRVESESGNDKLPVTIFGGSGRESAQAGGAEICQSGLASAATNQGRRSCTVSLFESSQFVSALKLSARHGGWDVKVAGNDAEEAPYVQMTEKLVEVFPWEGGKFQIEPDASSGSYFWGANWLISAGCWMHAVAEESPRSTTKAAHFQQLCIRARHGSLPAADDGFRDLLALQVRNWPTSGWQIDAEFPAFLPLPGRVSREGQLGDSIMTAMVIAADESGGWGLPQRTPEIQFTDLGRLRVQECERVAALRTELTRCGATVAERDDTLTIYPGRLHGAEIETYDDHRMALCFAMLGLKVPGIRLRHPSCVKKTFPNFFQKLAAPPPHGCGAQIWEVRNDVRVRPLAGADLLAT
ncbi:MAG TPA: hypothetical protein PKN95_13355 [Verrucomicrobiota bacterium]|nr:hypothetical protein [Verrucomicrobiota bacterium]HNT15636.1 hypothetical protein [Verrucomicrobiota bacterium]